MDEMPSAQFRQVYAKLTQPTVVTVNGHPIGTYQPISAAIDTRAVEAIRPGEPSTPVPFVAFRPAPKPGAKR